MDCNIATFSNNFVRDSVRFTYLVTPVASVHKDHRELGQDDGAPDGCCLFAAFHTKANMTIVVAHHHKGLEVGVLTQLGLLLHGHDLHDFIFKGQSEEELHNLVLVDGQGER